MEVEYSEKQIEDIKEIDVNDKEIRILMFNIMQRFQLGFGKDFIPISNNNGTGFFNPFFAGRQIQDVQDKLKKLFNLLGYEFKKKEYKLTARWYRKEPRKEPRNEPIKRIYKCGDCNSYNIVIGSFQEKEKVNLMVKNLMKQKKED